MSEDVSKLCPVGSADDAIALNNALACRVFGRGEDGIGGVRGLAVGESEVDEDVEPGTAGGASIVASEAIAGRMVVDDVLERAGRIGDLNRGDMPPVVVQFR
ncbi:MAG: hypothetical protein ABIS07_16950 [Dokdonella sp.]